jgi:hypothetical protein
MTRIESLTRSLESYKAQLAVTMFDYQAKRLQTSIDSIERALAKS